MTISESFDIHCFMPCVEQRETGACACTRRMAREQAEREACPAGGTCARVGYAQGRCIKCGRGPERSRLR
jgi:hypothetical protein